LEPWSPPGKIPKLESLTFQVVKQLDDQKNATGGYVVAVDTVGAGLGDLILYATGSSARQTIMTDGKPADAAIMAIIDSWDVSGKLIFQK